MAALTLLAASLLFHIAVARDRRGVPSVWLADIGDNDARRAEVRIYRGDEPRGGIAVAQPEVWRVRYPDGPHDAESLAVAPGGAAFIVTKSLLGSSAVYAVPARPGGVQTLRKIGEIRFALTGTPGGPAIVGQLTATGAAFSWDGTLLAVRTYTDAYLWRVTDGDVAAALRAPRSAASPRRDPQDRDPLPIGIAAAAVAVAGFLGVCLVRRRR